MFTKFNKKYRLIHLTVHRWNAKLNVVREPDPQTR